MTNALSMLRMLAVALWIPMLLMCVPGLAQASTALDDWRGELVRVRNLAENDAPRADQEARILQADPTSETTMADKVRVLNLRSRIEVYTAQLEVAAGHAQHALELASQHADRVGQAQAYLNLSLTSVNQGKIDVLMDVAPRALEVLQGVDRPDLLGEAMLRVAMMYQLMGQLDESMTLCLQAMDIARRSNDPMALLYAHQGLGNAFMHSARHVEAGQHFTQMRELARTLQVKQLEAAAMEGLASSAGQMGNWHAAELLLREVVKLYRSVGVPFNIAHGLYALADSLRQQGMLTQSLHALDEAMGVYGRSPNKIGLWWTLNARSENLQALGRFALAKADAERAYVLAQQINVLLYRSESATRMASVSAAVGEHELAYQFSAQALELAGKMAREKSNVRVGELASKYQNDSRQRKIDELNLLEQQRNLEQRWLWTVLGGSLLVLALAVVFVLRLRRSHHLLEAANGRLRQSQDDIQALNVSLEQRVQARTDALRQQTRYLRTLIDALPVWLWLKDSEGRYLTVNVNTATLNGYRPQQMIGKTDEELLLDQVGESFRATDIEVMQTRQRKTWDRAVPGKDGAVSWHEIDKVPVIDIDGTVLGTVGIGRDITERKRMEDQLAKRERDFRSLAENLPVAVIRYDAKCRRRYLNPAAERMLHGHVVELLGGVPGDGGVPASTSMTAHYRCMMEEVLATATEQELDFVLDELPADQQEHYEVRFVPEQGADGKTAGVLAIWYDISERIHYEQTLLERAELEQRQSQFFNVAPGFFYTTVRHPDGKYEIAFASSGIHELLGLEPDAVMQDSSVLFGVAHPDDMGMAARKSEESERDLSPYHLEYRIIHPVKGLRWMEVHLLTQRLSDGGTRWDGFMHDITERKRLEEQLAQRERDFRSLADNLPDNVTRWDVDGCYLYLNPVHERTLGVSAGDMIGKGIPDSHVHVKAAIAQAVATGQAALMVQQPVPDAHGVMRLHDVSIVPERDSAGKIVSVLGIGRDMTDVYRMQEALATREQEFRSLAESSPDFITRYDRECRHLYFNDRLLRQLGLASADEALGKRPGEVWPDGRFAELEQVVARAMESGCQGEIEIVEPAEGGGFRYHQIFVVPEHDAAGLVIGAIAFGREITGIREAEHKLAHFIDNLPGMAFTFRISPDGHGCFPYVSSAIEDIYGLKPEDVKDNMAALHAMSHPDDQPRIEAAIAESVRTMEPSQIETRVCRPGQPERWLDVRTMPERQADGSLLWYGLMLDITERKRAQVELQRSERELCRQAQFQQSLLSALIDAGVVLCVVENGKFVYTNDHYLGCQLGYAKGQMPAPVEFIDLIHPDDRPRIAEMYCNRLAGKPVPSSYEIGALAGDGSRLDYEFHVTTVPGTDPVQTLVFALNIAERKNLEIELKRRETEFRALAENLPDPVFRYDRDCRRTYVNPAAERVTNMSRDQLLGHLPSNCATVKPESAVKTMTTIREVFATGERRALYVEYLGSDGSTREYQGMFVPEFDANGQVVSVLTMAHEVTSLRAAERRATSFFANVPGFVFTVRVPRQGVWSFPFVSSGIEELYGLRPEDVKDDITQLHRMMHPRDRPHVEAALVQSLRTRTPYHAEFRLQRAGLPERWMECRSMPEQQAGGEELWHGIMLDITERKQAQERLELLESAIDLTSDAIYLIDEALRFTYVNASACRTLGYSREELLALGPTDIDPDMDMDTAQHLMRTSELGAAVNFETRHRTRDGHIFPVELNGTHFERDGATFSISVVRDITERKRYEAARDEALAEAVRLAKTRSEFLAHMSHELRTPLNGILGYTQILQRDKALSERNADALKVIRQSGEHLLALVEDILDLARIEAGRLSLDVGEISLATFLRGVTDIVSVRALEKGIEFSCVFAHDLPADIRADEKRLRQVLLNLLANAVKFTRHGRVVLHVSRVDALHLAFMVEDTGVGIAANELEAVFHPFEQSGDARQRFGGSGLGLSISRQLMRLMGGDIWVESRLGEGSRFGFELALSEAAAVSVPVPMFPMFMAPVADMRSKSSGNAASADNLGQKMLAPPEEELKALHHLAQLGSMRDIVQYAERLAEVEPRYQPFVTQLRQLAQAYQSKAILAFINEYLHANTP